MADSWEDLDDDDQKPVAVASGAYADENEDDVAESWEDQDDAENDKPTTATGPIRKKKNIQQVIKERQEAEERKQRELAEKKAAALKEAQEDPVAKQARLRKLQEEEDLKNAIDLFGAVSTKETAAAVMSTVTAQSQLEKVPVTKDELDQYATTLASKIVSWKTKSTLYVPFLEKLIRELVEPIDFTEIRKLSNSLSTLSNEKQRLDKEKRTGKKATAPKKASVKMEFGETEDFRGTGSYDDFDDFM